MNIAHAKGHSAHLDSCFGEFIYTQHFAICWCFFAIREYNSGKALLTLLRNVEEIILSCHTRLLVATDLHYCGPYKEYKEYTTDVFSPA
jgi:hypothetical protein